ncbi:MAG: DUF4124 domain-containing protein [Betaproteobacteria bacterium]|nr:DUF4124 domain-containing protein [Betaproteobacteria bacterium]
MRLLFALLLGLSPTVHAEIYKFVDERGNVTYTNIPRPGAKPAVVIPDAKGAAATTSGGKKIKASAAASPASFPKVDTGTQRKRDDMRRQLLLEELASEQRNLTAAKTAYAHGSRQPGADFTRLTESVHLHEKNIEMLNKELSHIK